VRGPCLSDWGGTLTSSAAFTEIRHVLAGSESSTVLQQAWGSFRRQQGSESSTVLLQAKVTVMIRCEKGDIPSHTSKIVDPETILPLSISEGVASCLLLKPFLQHKGFNRKQSLIKLILLPRNLWTRDWVLLPED
jgi:hypothetical protein